MNSTSFSRPLAIALLCALPVAAQEGKQTLRITAKKGDQARFRAAMKQEQATDMGGQQIESTSETVKEMELKVLDVTDKGELLVEVKVVSVKGKMSNPMMGDVDFDSTKKSDDDDAAGPSFKRVMGFLAGKTIKATVSPDGSKITIQDGKDLIADAQKSMGGMARMGGSQITESTLAHEIEGLFGTFPAEATALGGTWDKKDTQQQMGSGMTIETKHKLDKVDSDRVRITFDGTVTAAKKEKADAKDAKKDDEGEEGGAAQIQQMMRNLKVENGKIAGWSEVSRKDGLVQKAESKTSMDVSMGEMMKMSTKSTSTIERLAADAKTPQSQPAKK